MKAHGHLDSALLVALHVGPRAGEQWGARWRPVDWTRGTLHIAESLYWIAARHDRARSWATKPPKTGHGDRTIRLSRAALEALKAPPRLGGAGAREDPAPGRVHLDRRAGGPIEHRNIFRGVFYPVCEAAGIPFTGTHGRNLSPPVLTFHGLRHRAATLALAATKDVNAVSRMLGRASTEFAMDVYGHVREKQQQQEIADYMDAAVRG